MEAYIREDHLARIKALGAIPSFLTTADKGVHVDSVPKLVLIVLAHFHYVVVFVPVCRSVILAPKRHIVNNLARPY